MASVDRVPHYRILMDAVPSPMFVKDADGRYLDVNATYLETTGVSRDTVIGKTMHEILPKEEAAFYAPREEQVMRTGVSAQLEVPSRFSDGSSRHVSITWTPYPMEDGRNGLIGVVSDVTAHRTAERALKETVDALTRSHEELRHITEVAAHDLQEPVRSVVSYCQLIRRELGEGLTDRVLEYMAFAESGARRMRDLTNDLAKYAQVLGPGPVHTTAVDLNQGMDQAVKRIEQNLGMPVREHIVIPAPLPHVMSNPQDLVEVLSQLVDNGLKFRAPDRDPKVEITARRVGKSKGPGMVEVSIADNGLGMKDEDLNRVFALFRRLHPIETFPGTGMGLAICRRIVDRAGGNIWVNSIPDQGSRFQFTLPASESDRVS